jgi:hypothetical protein
MGLQEEGVLLEERREVVLGAARRVEVSVAVCHNLGDEHGSTKLSCHHPMSSLLQ